MAGVRIWHPKARAGRFTFSQDKRPYRTWNSILKKFEATPIACFPCGKLHLTKTYHVNVDSDGFAIVSETVWDRMREYGAFGFQTANEVSAPPGQVIGFGAVQNLVPQELSSG
jgi:hypothetical protein